MYSKILFLNFLAASLMIMAIYCDDQGFQPLQEISPNDKQFVKVFQKMIPQMVERMNSTKLYRIIAFQHVYTFQMVGVIYDAIFVMGETKCEKSQIKRYNYCKFTDKQAQCGCDIWVDPSGREDHKLNKFLCEPL